MSKVVVIGAGAGGLAAARLLARNGDDVTVLERGPTIGGLGAGFELNGTALERYYHYLVPGEQDILDLLAELGLAGRIEWFRSSIGILTEGRVWPFTTPLDLIRFRPISMRDRMRAGLGALRLGRVRDWRSLDAIPAREWLSDLTSPAVTDVVWDPLLRAKFGPAAANVPAAWMWGRLQQRRGARRRGGEMLGYVRGGFALLFDALRADLDGHGATIRTSTSARRIVVRDGAVAGVEIDDGDELAADVVLFTGPLPTLPALLDDEHVDPRWAAAEGLGALCAVFDLPYALTSTFWTNVCDATVPFGGIIEHTNLVPTSHYGGRHVVYLSRYFVHAEDVATADPKATAKDWLKVVESLFPHVSLDDIGQLHAFRTFYGAPLVSVPYLERIPPTRSEVHGLYLSTTAQIYPGDRGLSEAIRRAGSIVGEINADAR